MTTRLTYPLDDSLRAAVSNMSRSEANRFRDGHISAQEKNERDGFYEKMGLLKTVAAIVAICSVVFFAAMPNFFTGCLAAVVSYGCFEMRTVSVNAQQVLDDFTLETKISGNKRACLDQLSKGTVFSRSIIHLLWR